MITLRRSEDRRHVKGAAQDTWMTFDPDNKIDPLRYGFHSLESLNEENLGPDMVLYPHSRSNIEIITYVREGTLIYQKGSGTMGYLRAGEFHQRSVSAGMPQRALKGSSRDSAHVFQCCFTPGSVASRSVQEQIRFPVADREGVLRLVASPDGGEASLRIHQDVRLYSSVLLLGQHLIHELRSGRGAWLHVVKGRVLLKDHSLRTGDGAALDDEVAVSFTSQEPAEILLFDLA